MTAKEAECHFEQCREGSSKYNSSQLQTNVSKSIRRTCAFLVGDWLLESTPHYRSAVLDYDKMERDPMPGLANRWALFIIHSLRKSSYLEWRCKRHSSFHPQCLGQFDLEISPSKETFFERKSPSLGITH